MYIPTIPEFFWTFSRFIDVLVEVPQLRIVYTSDKLDKWIIGYYCCIGFHVFSTTLNLLYRFVENQNGIPTAELIRFDATFLGYETKVPSTSPRSARQSPKEL